MPRGPPRADRRVSGPAAKSPSSGSGSSSFRSASSFGSGRRVAQGGRRAGAPRPLYVPGGRRGPSPRRASPQPLASIRLVLLSACHDFLPLVLYSTVQSLEYLDVPAGRREGLTAGSNPPVTRRLLRAGRSCVVRRFRPAPFASRRSPLRLLMAASSTGVRLMTDARSESKACSTWPAGLTARCDATFGAIRSSLGRPGSGAAPSCRAYGPERKRPRSARHTGSRSAATAWAGASTGGVGDQLILYASLMNTVPGSLYGTSAGSL